MMPAGFIKLQRSSTLDEVNDQDDHSYDQKEVNEPSQGIGTDQSQQPQYEQNNKYSPKHSDIPFGLSFFYYRSLTAAKPRLFGLQ